ncbi:MAG: MATE family efflux transporter [Burkholderiaceae bacterium]
MKESLRQAILELGKLSLPVFCVQIALMGNAVVDTIMAGQKSAVDLAAIGIGTTIYITAFVILNGLFLASPPMFAKIYGAGEFRKLGQAFVQVSWVSMLIATPCAVILWNAGMIVPWMTESAETTLLVEQYLKGGAVALPAILWFRVFYALSTALGHPFWVVVINGGAVLLKIAINGSLMYGIGSVIPPLGAAGCGVALAIVSWMAALLSVLVLLRAPAYVGLMITLKRPEGKAIREFIRHGAPISIMQAAEIGSVAAVGTLAAKLGDLAVGAHQIAMNIATLLFMAPLAVSLSMCVLVARSIGEGNSERSACYSAAGAIAIAVCALVASLSTLSFHTSLGLLYTQDQELAAVADRLIIMIALIVPLDGCQVYYVFLLRAYSFTVAATIVSVSARLGIGVFAGYLMAFNTSDLGVEGLWIGIAIGLICAVIALAGYSRQKLGRWY